MWCSGSGLIGIPGDFMNISTPQDSDITVPSNFVTMMHSDIKVCNKMSKGVWTLGNVGILISNYDLLWEFWQFICVRITWSAHLPPLSHWLVHTINNRNSWCKFLRYQQLEQNILQLQINLFPHIIFHILYTTFNDIQGCQLSRLSSWHISVESNTFNIRYIFRSFTYHNTATYQSA